MVSTICIQNELYPAKWEPLVPKGAILGGTPGARDQNHESKSPMPPREEKGHRGPREGAHCPQWGGGTIYHEGLS